MKRVPAVACVTVFLLLFGASAWWVWVGKPAKLKSATSRTFLSLAKFRMFSGLKLEPEQTVAAGYQEGMEFLKTNQLFAVVSADKIWLRPTLRAGISDWHLLPDPYLRKHNATLKDAKRVFEQHGAGFEVLTVRTNLLSDVLGFGWAPPLPLDTSGVYFGFPLIWSKHPDLTGGVRFFADVKGDGHSLPERDFTNYMRYAMAWLRRDASEAWMDSLIETGIWSGVANGGRLLHRMASTNMEARIARACESPNMNSMLAAVEMLANCRSEAAVEALARIAGSSHHRAFLRETAAKNLRWLAYDPNPGVRASALAAIERLQLPP